MLRRYAEQILNVFNYIDAIIVTNADGIIEYYVNRRPHLNRLREEDISGMHILELYPYLTEETSSICRVLRSGQPIYNEYQSMRAVKTGQVFNGINTTIPIKHDDKVIGVAEVTRWADDDLQRKDISLSLKQTQEKEEKSMQLYTVDDIITCAPQMKEIKERIKRIAETDSTVLIYGQTGTGKELIAQSIHTAGKRRAKRFVSQNCAAIPETLLESILFGTTKGSYTGAENRPGLFEVASGGTLFLDEINSMELGMQAKLLKVIEEKKVTRIGSTQPIPIDVKVVSAVNEPPENCVSAKKLREDLFYRLSVVRLDIPPLSARPGDVQLLTRYFLDYFNARMDRDVMDVSEEVEQLFQNYTWPGNVREMKNIIEGAYNLISSRIIQLQDLPEYLTRNDTQTPLQGFYSGKLPEGKSLAEMTAAFEKEIITRTLAESKSLSEAARTLRITKQGLSYKILKYDIHFND